MDINCIEKLFSEMLEKQKIDILNETRKLLKEHEKIFASITAANMKIITERLDKNDKDNIDNSNKIIAITNDLELTNKSVTLLVTEFSEMQKFIQANDDIISGKLELLKKKTKEINNKIKDNSEITKIKSKLREIEDRSRRNNLRIDGLKESENENWNETELKVQKFFEDLLGLKNIKIERAHRTGIRDSKKIRTVVIKLLNYKDKVAILKNVQKLKGKKIYVNEDYCAETILIRKDLKERMKKERELGKFAVISYDKLIVREWIRKEYLRNNGI
ncbi:uncharacterized protein LOC136075231 [Hydra vulgaris]|uniref:Uncharacterized protein LOC136075231 n=1 Tax=Hydra vulgaris TaxID=6087 RepID=A0ABM4B4R3_HYDVU